MTTEELDQTLDALREKHGEIVVVETKAGPCAFRACSRSEHDRYQSLVFDKKTQHKAGETLVLLTCVYPEKPEFQKILDKYPFTSSTCFTAVAELSGLVMEPDVKKLGSG